VIPVAPDSLIRECRTAEDYAAAEAVTRAYVDWLGIDLGFQDIDREMAEAAGVEAGSLFFICGPPPKICPSMRM